MTLQETLVLSLASYRGTKLIIDDEITSDLRSAVISALNKYPTLQSKVSYLLSCPWCTSPYVAATLLLVKRIAPDVYDVLASVLVASAAAGLIYENL